MSEDHPTVAEIAARIMNLSRELGARADKLEKEKGTPAVDALERASAELARTGMLLERFVAGVVLALAVMTMACGPAFTVAPGEAAAGGSGSSASSGALADRDAGEVLEDAGELHPEDAGHDAGEVLPQDAEPAHDAGELHDAASRDAGEVLEDAGGGQDAGHVDAGGRLDAGGGLQCSGLTCPACASGYVCCTTGTSVAMCGCTVGPNCI